jgi:methylmalonyl-CoA mutase N-terminal domain/subunit
MIPFKRKPMDNANSKRTTKGILDQVCSRTERVPLYNPAAIDRIARDLDRWLNVVVDVRDREQSRLTPHSLLGSEVPRSMLYTPLDAADLDYGDLGFPGQEPYTRGIHPNMYRGRTFTMRQLCGAGSREYINQRIRSLLDHGATGVNLILDAATIQMYDSDEPEAKGQVGTVGVPIDCSEDMDAIFLDVPIDKVSVSIVTHYPQNTAILFPMYLVMAERRGIPWNRLQGSVQNDFVMETVVRSASQYISPRDAFRIQCDNIQFLRTNVPKWNCVTFNGYNLREFGTSGVTEMAVALANAIETVSEMERRGHGPDYVGERLAFFWSFASDFFEEVARLRAVRRLWYRIMRYRFQAQNPKSMWMRCHVQTSGISLTREEPMNNIVRAAFHALAAILGGAQSLHVDSYDEAYSVPSEDASLLSLRTQQIIQAETAVTEVVDPLGGSFYVEALTNEMERRILDELDEIERLGGLITAIEKGWLHGRVNEHIKREQEMIDDGEIRLVGRNYLRSPGVQMPDLWVHENDAGLEADIAKRLRQMRQQRNKQEVDGCLDRLRETCRAEDNVMASCVEAVRAGATEGEMRRAFAEAFGVWSPPKLTF